MLWPFPGTSFIQKTTWERNDQLMQFFKRHWPASAAEQIRLDQHSLPLDGVRGIAVLLVLCYDCLKLTPGSDPVTYAARWVASIGWIGVDLFFVLSGFLITGVLLETRGRPGYWKSFILRRSVRIFPLYYVTLFTVFCVIPLGLWLLNGDESLQATFREGREDQLWYWLYAENWLFAWKQDWPAALPLKHFWSLAIEEQFYLVWPFAVAALTRGRLGWLCVGLSLLSIVNRCCLLAAGVSPMVIFVMTLTRLDGLCTGALLAIALRDPVWKVRLAKWTPRLAVVGLLLLAGLNEMWPVLSSETTAAYSIGHTLVAVTFAMLISAAQCVPEHHMMARVLSTRLLTTFGKYSYAIYVFHKFIYLGLTELSWSAVPESLQGWAIYASAVGGSLLSAQVSWVLLERPCLSLKKYFPRPDMLPKGTCSSQITPRQAPKLVCARVPGGAAP